MSKKVPAARIVGGLLLAFGIFQIISAIYRGPSFTAFPRLDRYLPYVGALLNIVLGIMFLREKREGAAK
jgi:hypothetical protein